MMTTSLATVAVIGSGTMGAGIAEVAAAAGHPVRIFDINPKAVDLAIEGIAGRLASRVARGKLASEQADALLARLHPAHDLAALADADLVSKRPLNGWRSKRRCSRSWRRSARRQRC